MGSWTVGYGVVKQEGWCYSFLFPIGYTQLDGNLSSMVFVVEIVSTLTLGALEANWWVTR